MTSFEFSEYLFPADPRKAGLRDLGGLPQLYIRRAAQRLSPCKFTELDQAFVVWAGIALVIFAIAQFSSLSWTTQALVDAALTGAGIASTSGIVWPIAGTARLRWVVMLWAVLMSSGMVLTAWGIFGTVATILANLCPLWLGLCTLGYWAMAKGMRSRCFSVATWVHALAIPLLTLYPRWQFLASGLVMGLTLLIFSVVPWDMQEVTSPSP